jgi:hypothetical protein
VELSNNKPRPAVGVSTDWRRRSWLIAVATALGIGGLALVVPAPPDRPRVDADSASAWLPSVQAGFVGRANALMRSPGLGTTDRISLAMSAGASVVRRGSVLVIGDAHSGAAVVDLRALKIDPVTIAATEHLDVVDGQVFRIDDQAGRVGRMASTSASVDLQGTPIGRWTVSGGALWLTIPATGSVIRVGPSGAASTVTGVFPVGHNPFLATMSAGVAVLDPGTGEVDVLTGTAPPVQRYRTDLVPAMLAASAGVVTTFQVAPDGAYAVILAKGDRSTLIIEGMRDGRPTVSRSMGDSGDTFGTAVLLHDRIYVSDDSTGSLAVAQVRPKVSPVSSIGLAYRPTALEVFAKGSMVWANDLNGPNALAIYADTRWAITKYRPAPSTPSVSPPSGRPPSTTGPSTAPPVPTHHPPVPATGANTGKPSPKPSPAGHKDTARITNLHNGSSVERCQNVDISADLGSTKTLLLAHHRTSPLDTTYFFNYAGSYENGQVPASFHTTWTFGAAADQSYDFYLLIMDVGDARTFWSSHVSTDGSFATSGSIPGNSFIAEKIEVTKLARTLTAAGIPVVYEREAQSDATWDGLRTRVDASAAVVVVMTEAAGRADRVETQIGRAEEQSKPLFPLLLSGRPFFRLVEREYWDVTGRMPGQDFVDRLGSAVGVPGPPGPSPRKSWWRGKAGLAAAVVAALVVVGGAMAVLTNRDASGQANAPTGGSPSAVSAPPPGAVEITDPANGGMVDRCAQVKGRANLDSGKTMLFAVNRTEPVDTNWYFGYVGAYSNGFVPADWSGTVYFGSASRQSYDVFILVMDVPAAKDFWNKHKSADGSFAAAPALPQGVPQAAHVHVQQGTTDDC